MTEDSTLGLVTAEKLPDLSAMDGQLHVTLHVGILCTTIVLINPSVLLTVNDINQVSLDIGILTGSKELVHT